MSFVELTLDGERVRVPDGVTVAVALMNSDIVAFRTSVTGEPRGAVCGMGTCLECRVTINGVPETRACLTVVQEGMAVVTRA